MKTQVKLKKFDKLVNELAGEYYIVTLPVYSILDFRTGISLIRKKDMRETNAFVYDEGDGITVEIGAGIQMYYFKSYKKAIDFIKSL
jgi:hypothetical protein